MGSMTRYLLLAATAIVAAGCATLSPDRNSIIWNQPPPLPEPAAVVRFAELPWFGERLTVEDPSNSDYSGVTVPVPQMPL
jgi:hypothetical protein